MLAAFAIASLTLAPLSRDSYGVPHIVGQSWEEAFEWAGYAVAQDRLWQMETSRRLSRGKLAEVLGETYANADRELLRVGYTDEELTAQFKKTSDPIQSAFTNYAKGINRYIGEGKLPEGYAKNGFKPEPWTVEDSVAIAIRLFQQFGRGGAGEIRNMALYTYLAAQPALKGRELDAIDDFAWLNDPRAVSTVMWDDDLVGKRRPVFPVPDRKQTQAHLDRLPKLGLFELLPGVRLASNEESTRVAENLAAPFKVGSYCIAVAGSRSASGQAMLLSGPQMGFQQPSIVHEMSIRAPGLAVVGMDVPGVPGIAVGHTEKVAWGLTSGVADTDDVFFAETTPEGMYKLGKELRPIQALKRTLKVKGKADETVDQRRTHIGPIVLAPKSTPVIFTRRAGAWMQELQGLEALYSVYAATNVDEVDKAAQKATVNFNLFAADTSGRISYNYCGRMPLRAVGVDPRFPAPIDMDWQGIVPADQLPFARDPNSGLFVNWNNKPAVWWPNGDTPVWGRIFRNQLLLDQLTKRKLTTDDLELAIWTAARSDYNYKAFAPYLAGLSSDLDAFKGLRLEGSIAAGAYTAFFDTLRTEIFQPVVGGLMTPDNFKLAIQPSLMIDALEGRTKVKYLGRRSKGEILTAAWEKAKEKLGADRAAWRYNVPSSNFQGQRVPYSDRGTFIQIVELFEKPLGRSVLPPGVSETGEHSQDQIPLARAWMFKPMLLP